MKFGVGQPVPRLEDPRLVTGGGQFADDITFSGQLYAAFCRSPHAHGSIETLDVRAAARAPGVVRVYVQDDLADLGGLPCRAQVSDRHGTPCFVPHRPVLAERRVLFVGQAVAAVIADTAQAALDALDLIELTVREDAAAIDLEAAALGGPIVHPERADNLSVHFENGDDRAVDAALNASAHVVRVKVVNNRVIPMPLEPRASVAIFEAETDAPGGGKFTLYNPSQGAVAQQGVIANAIFKVDPQAVRVVSGDTGGGFGVRGEVHPETVVCLFAARELGRPVKWNGSRSEMFLADSHGRDNVTTGTLGVDRDGHITGLKIETLANLGAYCTAVGPFVPTMGGGRVVGTVYRSPATYHSVKCVFTNTMPVAAYRGAGRPEAAYITERLMERAAAELGLDSRELRRRNFIRPQDLPFTNHAGIPITSGAFAETMDLAMERADWSGFAARRRLSEARGMVRGIGFGCYVESSGGGPEEEAKVTVLPDGSVELVVGTFSHGQGHRTTYAQIVVDALGVEIDQVRLVQGDTEHVRFGGGTGGSRSSQMGGVAVLRASGDVVASGKRIAAQLLQAQSAQIEFEAGIFRDQSSHGEVTLAEVARSARSLTGAELAETHRYNRGSGYTFPNGCHVAEVEIDPDTGAMRIVRYTAVDDCGRVINPLLAAGQVHGGVVQGLGQAVLESIVYDPSGQLLTGSLMDYAMPRASHVPSIDVSFNEVLEPTNELGVKGIGEGGACGAPPAIVHAVLDALRPFAVEHIDMPLTSEKIWRAMHRAAAP